ncbi:MAG: hypothetical protein ACRYG6_15005 [Janthinobacterium lividum]
MRPTTARLRAAALLAAAALVFAGPVARAQTAGRDTATGMSGPASNRASNIDHADTAGGIAPHLPQPDAPDNAGPATLLRAADQALAERRTGAAQQALEMAETRLLDRSTEIGASGQPNQDPRVLHIRASLQALGRGDIPAARAGIAVALNGAMPPGPMQASPMHVPMAGPR